MYSGKASDQCNSSCLVEKPGQTGCKSNNVNHYRTRFIYNSNVKPKLIEASLARKSSDSIAHVKKVVKTGSLNSGMIPKTCMKQSNSQSNVSSIIIGSAQHNLSPPAVQPVASSVKGVRNDVRDDQPIGVEQPRAEVIQNTVTGPGLYLNIAQDTGSNNL